MANLTTDSPIACRIVRAFLGFLNSVEPAPGVDLEGLEVAQECLTEVFKLNKSSADDHAKPDSLVEIFNSLGGSMQQEAHKSGHELDSMKAPSSSSAQNAAEANHSDASKSLDEEWTRASHSDGMSKDELCGQFFSALEKIHFFRTAPDGSDDPVQLEKAYRLFDEALTEMGRSAHHELSLKNLAESLKSQGNKALQSKLYSDAIELYSCAIGLCENNAVYYCNRAAAYTQIHKYTEAIRDCFRSIEIDPNYSKAYSRLGLAYYAQGNYRDAIEKGFRKALQLDPSNESVKENIRVAEQKLIDEHQHAYHDQNTNSSSHSNQGHQNQAPGGSRSQGTPPPFTSMPFDVNGLPADLASMFMNMAANAQQGQHSQERQGEENNPNGPNEPEVRIGGNINLNFEQMPEDLTGALRSMMDMFSGAASRGQPPDHMNGRTPPN
ncbi:Small glutamine-rich tetratricopeptide repeat-containing protein [Quillaja saponaria]|uniref:Small glutamine-rich tetratricopeptide repeat-containing protein n=1 Tax=Quillaja saponaria TaxID=32244 RepID=A0AAD7LJ66_QUISA|nr:Small glutamine-rich tetratricopeptide repeat-containing protein [Quillaja saponaria]